MKHQHKLTQSQSLLWIGQELNPDSPMYNMVMTYELKLNISATIFKQAFQKLVQKHDALRSVFIVEKGIPYQVFSSGNKIELSTIDFSNKENPIDTYKTWKKKKTTKKFDVSKSLVDSVLIKLGTAHYIWYINQHHLITDAWSNGILFSDLVTFYSKLEKGEELLEVEEPASFQEYIEKEFLSRTNTKNNISKEFWTNKIDDNLPKLSLYNQSTDAAQKTASTRHYINLGVERSKRLRSLANEKGIRVWTAHLSLYNLFLTTFFAFLNRASGQQKLFIGSPTHNRFSKKAKETVGYFVEIFPLLATIDEDETFVSLLQKIQLESNDFLKHAKPGLSTAQLHRNCHVLFNYIHADYKDFNGENVVSEWVHSGHHDSRHQIRLHVHDLHNTGEIQLYFDFNNQIFDAEKQQQIPQHFINLLDAFIEDKNQLIAKPSIITTDEIHQLKQITQQKVSKDFINENITTLIEQQVTKTPSAISVVFNNTTYSYQELNEKVNQFAHYLKAKKVKKNTQVAIWLKRSIDYVISVLAVLKTGATYIPIPYNYPKERVLYILEDSKSSFVITNNKSQFTQEEISTNYIQINDLWSRDLQNYPTHNLSITIPKKSTAFLIYTSGSTGNPKGVKITHEAIANYIQWTKNAYIEEHHIQHPSIPLFTTVGFDITANSVFLPLICGGSIQIYQEKETEIDLSVLDVFRENKVDFVKLTPAHLNFLKGENLSQNTTKVLVVTGDEFKTELAKAIHNAFDGKVHIYNEYGPSEATIGCIYHKFNNNEDTKASVPIGIRIKGMNMLVLDQFFNLVPKGVVGELYLGGVGLSSGYWNREKLTNEKFIQNPYSINQKIYKTGDLVRFDNNDNLEFLGRTDFQVKINGYRIELAEIESKILKFSYIKSCAVLVLEKKDNLKILVAYFTATESIDLKDLQLFLSQKLPKYMVPVQYKQLPTLPLSANAKVDRKALIKIETQVVDNKIVYVAPRNEIEEEVAEIWYKVFNLKRIGIYESFIALGGESLMAIQITSRINETFELNIPLNKIFELQTIANIANHIEEVLINLLKE